MDPPLTATQNTSINEEIPSNNETTQENFTQIDDKQKNKIIKVDGDIQSHTEIVSSKLIENMEGRGRRQRIKKSMYKIFVCTFLSCLIR